jgi:serine/threonine-protein kinase
VQTQHGATVIADRYVLEEELVRCAAGTTVRARDRLLGRDVAVTLIHPALGDDDTFAACLFEERKRVAKVSGRGIARLLDTGEEDGILFLVREHVDGETAREVLRRDGPLDTDVAVGVGVAVLDALALAHDSGVLHLGIGVDDVVVKADGTTSVTGLGIPSAVVEGKPRESTRFIGDRLAPEVAARASPEIDDPEIDARADVFAVGALVFELLTGEAPGGRSSPRALRSDVPRAVDRVIARALAPDPRDRFLDARVFSTALHQTRHGLSVSARDDVLVEASRLEWLRTWVAAPFAIAAVAAAVIGLGLWFGRLEVGGPLGIRPAEPDLVGPSEPTTEVVTPAAVATFDPFGDGSENDSTAPYAVDGDPSTAWRSENYFDGSLHKQGVGLVFDLGERRAVTAFRLIAPNAGYVFHTAVGDDPESLLGGVGSPNVAESDTRGELVGEGRYVLIWITTVVPAGDGIRAEIAEFRAVVEAA